MIFMPNILLKTLCKTLVLCVLYSTDPSGELFYKFIIDYNAVLLEAPRPVRSTNQSELLVSCFNPKWVFSTQ